MDNINNIVCKFRNHPSIIKSKEKVQTNVKFSFTVKTPKNIEEKIMELDASKPTLTSFPNIYTIFIKNA